MLNIDVNGFDHMDRLLLLTMIDKFQGGPVGVDSLAAAISEERGTIEDVLEPYLIQQGYMMRTPRGRVLTPKAYAHFELNPPQANGQLSLIINMVFRLSVRVYIEDTDGVHCLSCSIPSFS